MTASLSIHLFGQPTVYYQGKRVTFPTKKSLALLIYLVMEPKRHQRAVLMTLLWPNSKTRSAQASLRNALARLRKALPVPELVLATKETMQLNPEVALVLDVAALATALQTAVSQGQGEGKGMRVWERGVAQYDDHFLALFHVPQAPSFDHWQEMQQERLWQQVCRVYELLLDYYLSHHQLVMAKRQAERWLGLDSCQETAVRGLMQAHFLLGQPQLALQLYERLVEELAHRFATSPAVVTVQLAVLIRQTPMGVQSAQTSGMATPLVGRADEYAQLVAAYQIHCLSTGRAEALPTVLVSGEAGGGKTRLVTDFLAWTGMQQADVIQGRAFEAAGNLPYQPIMMALRERLERENAPEDLLSDVWLAELSHLLPELRERYPDLRELLVEGGEQTSSQARLFEAMARLLSNLAQRRPVVLFIDDWQWADEGSRDFLSYWAQMWRQQPAPILLLLTVRSENWATDSALKQWLQVWSGLVLLQEVSLLALTPVDIEALLYRQLADEGEMAVGETAVAVERDVGVKTAVRAISRRLFTEIGGNPFFVVEVLKLLLASTTQPAVMLAQLETGVTLPATVRKVILSRLSSLDETSKGLLIAAAVLGRHVAYEELCHLVGVNELVGLPHLEGLLAQQLLYEVGAGGVYQLPHDKMRDVIYTEAGYIRRRVYHRRALVMLVARGAPVAELAHHALVAQQWQEACRYHIEAGDEALALYAVKGAIAFYGEAQQLLQAQQLSLPVAEYQHLFGQLAYALELAYAYEAALAVYVEMEETAVLLGDQRMQLTALVKQGRVYSLPYEAHDVAAADAVLQRAGALATTLNDVAAQAHVELNLVAMYDTGNRNLEAMQAHAYRGAQLAREAQLPALSAQALLHLATLYMNQAQYALAETAYWEAVDLFRQAGQLEKVRVVIHALGVLYVGRGDFAKAQRCFDDAVKANEAFSNANQRCALAASQNVIDLVCCDYDKVQQRYAALASITSPPLVARMFVEMQLQLAWLCYHVGAYARGVVHCQQALACYDEVDEQQKLQIYTYFGLLYLGLEEMGQLAKVLAHGRQLPNPIDTPWAWAWEAAAWTQVEAEVALAQGDLAVAVTHAARLHEMYTAFDLRHFLPTATFLRGRVAWAQGDGEGAYGWLKTAVVQADSVGVRREVAGMSRLLSEVAVQLGHVAEAVQWQARAEAEGVFQREQVARWQRGD